MKQKFTLLSALLILLVCSHRGYAQNIYRQSFDTTNILANTGAFGWTDSVDYAYCCAPTYHWYYGPPLGGFNSLTYMSPGPFGYGYVYPSPPPHTGKGMAQFNTNYMYGPYCCGIGAGHTELHTPSVSVPATGRNTVSYWLYVTRPYSYSPPYYTSDSVSVWVGSGPRYAGATRSHKVGIDNVSTTLGWVQYTDTLPSSFYGTNAYISFVGWPGYYDYYNADINMDDVTVDHYTSCSGHPTAGYITGPTHICQNKAFTLIDTSLTYLLGMSYQWQSRATSTTGAWTTIAGATGNSYTTTLGSVGSTDFRVYATCANSGLVDTSNTITVLADLFYKCYCAIPTTNTTLGGNTPPTIDSVAIVGTSLHNRTATALAGPNFWAQYPDTMNTTTILTKGGFYTAYVRYAGGTGYGMAWIDYNRNGTFDASEFLAVNTSVAFFGTVSFTVPLTASTGKTGFRIRNGSVYYPSSGYACSNFGSSTGAGETEDYIINIQPQPSHDLGVIAVNAPASGVTYCANRVDTLSAKVYNFGNSAESNFYVYATYTDPSGTATTLYTKYTGILTSGASDNVYVGTINPPVGGKYALSFYTVLTADTIRTNDTSKVFMYLNPLPSLPTAYSDTVCPGTSIAVIGVTSATGYRYNWYSAPTGGTPFKTDTTVSVTYPTHDSIFYVTTVNKATGCESNKIPVTIAVRNAPVVNLGPDLTMCESPSFTLDAGNPGGKYLWNTGDTTRLLHVRNTGTYSVKVFHYCTSSDTVNMTINPLPHGDGVDYVRSGNTYLYSVSGGAYINSYLWFFGDGDTSSQATPLHTYKVGNIYTVKVVLFNACGSDTVVWTIPTGINSLKEQNSSVKIYPNPANSVITVSAENNSVELKDIQILNAVGAVVYKGADEKNSTTTINVAQFPAGHYILRANTTKGYVNRIIEIVH